MAEEKLDFDSCIVATGRELPDWTTQMAGSVQARDFTRRRLALHTYLHALSKFAFDDERERKLKAGRADGGCNYKQVQRE